MEATEYDSGWIYLRWVNNKRGSVPKKLLLDLICVEDFIIESELLGWFTNSDKDHKEFHRLLKRVGAEKWTEDADSIQFIKWIKKDEDKYNVRITSRRTPTAAIS